MDVRIVRFAESIYYSINLINQCIFFTFVHSNDKILSFWSFQILFLYIIGEVEIAIYFRDSKFLLLYITFSKFLSGKFL